MHFRDIYCYSDSGASDKNCYKRFDCNAVSISHCYCFSDKYRAGVSYTDSDRHVYPDQCYAFSNNNKHGHK